MKSLRILLWRTFYKITSSILVVQIVNWFIQLVNIFLGWSFTRKAIQFLAYLLTANIPRPPSGYIDLYASKFYRQTIRRFEGVNHRTPSRSPTIIKERPLRIGTLGYWLGTGPKKLFEAFPDSADLYVFDIQNNIGYRAEWLRSISSHYTPLVLRRGKIDTSLPVGWANTGYQPIVYGPEVSDAELVACAAQAINDAHLDMLMIYGHERENHTYALLDLIDTPCIVHLCNSPDIIHHEKVSYYIYTHPEGKYYLQGHQLFCAATQAPFSSKRMYPGSLYYDPRGFDLNAPVPLWAERDPLIVFHGALYKLAKSDVLDIIMQLLHEDSALEFVFMGRTDRQNWQLPRIESRAKRYGVASRVHYAGNFLARWDVTCSQVVPDWDKIVAYLQRARLYANPFPYGGGQARFQNYAAGVPCIHMGVEFGVSRGWRQYLVEVPALLVPSGTAFSQAEYLALCQRCLHDEEFANQLIEEQRVVGRRASDPSVYWGQLFDSYDDWLSQVNSKGESK